MRRQSAVDFKFGVLNVILHHLADEMMMLLSSTRAHKVKHVEREENPSRNDDDNVESAPVCTYSRFAALVCNVIKVVARKLVFFLSSQASSQSLLACKSRHASCYPAYPNGVTIETCKK